MAAGLTSPVTLLALDAAELGPRQVDEAERDVCVAGAAAFACRDVLRIVALENGTGRCAEWEGGGACLSGGG
jgi:hypothetical protein